MAEGETVSDREAGRMTLAEPDAFQDAAGDEAIDGGFRHFTLRKRRDAAVYQKRPHNDACRDI